MTHNLFSGRIFAAALTVLLSIQSVSLDAQSPIHFVVTSPGEDASSQIGINWHCFAPGSYLELKDASAKDFSRARRIEPESVLWSVDMEYPLKANPAVEDSLFLNPRYVCSVNLDGLMRNHKYEYRVVCGESVSPVSRFKTASRSGKWTFAAFTDFQSAFNPNTHPIIDKVLSLAGAPVPLVVCSGDMIDTSTQESQWRWLLDHPQFADFIYASSPGDHEYWASGGDRHIPQLPKPLVYNRLFNNPKNGLPERLNSCFYFRYDNVLFVSIDCEDSNKASSAMIDREVEWFRNTIMPLKGTYDYLVVLEHKSIFGSYKSDHVVAGQFRPKWAPVLREAGVDLVLSGHDHMFHRSVSIGGTYYLGMGTSGRKTRTPDEMLYTDGIQALVLDLKSSGQVMGATIDVDRDKMTVTVYDLSGATVDRFDVPKK